MAYVKITTPWHDDEFDRAMRQIPGAQYNTPAAPHCWIVPKEQMDAVRALKGVHFGALATATITRETADARLAECEGWAGEPEGSDHRRNYEAALVAWNARDYAAVVRYLR